MVVDACLVEEVAWQEKHKERLHCTLVDLKYHDPFCDVNGVLVAGIVEEVAYQQVRQIG